MAPQRMTINPADVQVGDTMPYPGAWDTTVVAVYADKMAGQVMVECAYDDDERIWIAFPAGSMATVVREADED